MSTQRLLTIAVLVAVLAVAGCVSQNELLDRKQDVALETALSRARFEMKCPEATGILLSRSVFVPDLTGPYVYGIYRAEYTVGIEGCGKRSTFVAICPDGGVGCFAAEGDRLAETAMHTPECGAQGCR